MAVIPDFKSIALKAFVQQNAAPGSAIYADGLKSFTGFEQMGFRHVPRTQPLQSDLRKGSKSVAPLADRAIGNLQQWLIGTYHGVSREQLRVYLDEFAFRHNRDSVWWCLCFDRPFAPRTAANGLVVFHTEQEKALK